MDFSKPGPNKRVCAFLIDALIGQMLGVAISFLIHKEVSYIVGSIFILFRDCLNGQSIGKRLIGTQVIGENNAPAPPFKTIIRNIFMIIPYFILVEYVKMSINKEGKRVGDVVAKTKVNDLRPQVKDGVFLLLSVLIVIALVIFQVKQHPELLEPTKHDLNRLSHK